MVRSLAVVCVRKVSQVCCTVVKVVVTQEAVDRLQRK